MVNRFHVGLRKQLQVLFQLASDEWDERPGRLHAGSERSLHIYMSHRLTEIHNQCHL